MDYSLNWPTFKGGLKHVILTSLFSALEDGLYMLKDFLFETLYPCVIYTDCLIYKNQDQDSLLVKHRNDNHSPGPVIWE